MLGPTNRQDKEFQIQMHKTKTFRLQEKAWLRWWVQPITRGRTSPPRSTSTRFPTPGSSSFMKIETGMESIFVGWRNLSLPWNRFCHRLRWALTQQISCENFDIKISIILCKIYKQWQRQWQRWNGAWTIFPNTDNNLHNFTILSIWIIVQKSKYDKVNLKRW